MSTFTTLALFVLASLSGASPQTPTPSPTPPPPFERRVLRDSDGTAVCGGETARGATAWRLGRHGALYVPVFSANCVRRAYGNCMAGY